MEKSELKSAIKEYNKVIVLENPISMKSETVEKDLYDALDVIEPEDEFSEETLAVFAELRKQFDKPKKEKKPEKVETKTKSKDEKKITVKAGTTVEMSADKDEIKIEKEMKKGKESGANPQVEIIKTILDRKVGKETLTELIKNEDVFADKKTKKALLAETNFMSLKKKMLDVFDEKLVKELRAELPPINHTPKAKAEIKSKPVVDNPIVNGIKSATKVKQLKKLAKENDQFNWKKLKKLDFEEIQDAMLKSFGQGKTKVKAAPAKPKMVPNPLIAEINEFKKLKKLIEFAKENEAFIGVKKIKKYIDIAELKSALVAVIPAEIEVKGKSKTPRNTDENVTEKRRAFLIPLLKAGEHTRPELLTMLNEKFGADDPHGAHPHNNMLSEMKNPKYFAKHNLGGLVEENKKGKYRFVK